MDSTPGAVMGATTRQMICHGVAPSRCADSSRYEDAVKGSESVACEQQRNRQERGTQPAQRDAIRWWM